MMSLTYKFIQFYSPQSEGDPLYKDPGKEQGLNRSLNVIYRSFFVCNELHLGLRLYSSTRFFFTKKIDAMKASKKPISTKIYFTLYWSYTLIFMTSFMRIFRDILYIPYYFEEDP